MTTSDTRYNLTLLNIKYVLSPVWGGERQGERLHVRGEGLGGRTHIRPDWDWQDSGELDADGVGDGDCRWQYQIFSFFFANMVLDCHYVSYV